MRRNRQQIYGQTPWWGATPPWLVSLANLVEPRVAYAEREGIQFAGRRVIDVGCGGGFMAERLARLGARVTGVDPSEEVLAQARRHAQEGGLDITYAAGRGEQLPVADGSAQRVVCVDVLEHVDDPRAVVFEVARALEPGGIFLFDTFNKTLFARWVMVYLAEDVLRLLPWGIHDPDKFITPAELTGMLKEAGFEVGRISGVGPRWINLRGELTFGLTAFTGGMYIGHAIKRG